MPNPTVRDGVAQFLRKRTEQSSYLIPQWSPELETQIVVHAGSNEVDGDSGDEDSAIWTDGETTWFNHRWPRNAWGDPHYKDRPLTFSLSTHLKCIGTTWWNWVQQRSIAVVFDVDAAEGHSDKTLTNTSAQLEEFVTAARSLPYATLLRSKSGNGFHTYIFFDENDLPQTKNHNEHASLAGFVLDKMSKDAEFDFSKYVDVKGGNFWIWASEIGPHGLELVQEGVHKLSAAELGDWQSVVLTTPNRPVIMDGYTESGDKTRETSAGGGFQVYDIDEDHKDILKALEDLPFSFRWLPQYNMAHTHTAALKALWEQRKNTENPILGLFETVSGGSDHRKPNCFISPRPDGVFRVSRFGNGTTEHPLWDSHEGKTWCYFNQEAPTLRVLQKMGGIELQFSAKELEAAMQVFGETLGENHTEIIGQIEVVLNKGRGTFTARFKDEKLDKLDGWWKKGKFWCRILPVRHDDESFTRNVLEETDKIVRYIRTPQKSLWGWGHATQLNDWMVTNTYEASSSIIGSRFGHDVAQSIKSYMVQYPWTLAHVPFANEYPGDSKLRLWNKDAPQFAYPVASEPGPHPTWDMILGHLGQSLNPYIRCTDWCSQWGIETGADYLRYWVACLIKNPFVPLPYLFFFGPQNCGKSTLFECLSLLFTPNAVVSAGTSLISQAGFNSELKGAVVAFIDEKDLSQSGKQCYERIKEWTMAENIPVHEKGKPQYMQRNTLHFIQVGNSAMNLPMEDGDTRITAIEVNPFQGPIIPKNKLFERLSQEAPFFLRTLITTNIPDQIGRTRLPVLETEAKRDLQKINQTPVEAFAEQHLFPCDGATITMKEFHEAYLQYCMTNEFKQEGIILVTRQLKTRSDKYAVGKWKGNQNYLANFTLNKNTVPSERLVVNDRERLVPVSEVS